MEPQSKRHPVASDVAAGVLLYLASLFVVGLLIPGGFAAGNPNSAGHFLASEMLDALLLVSIPLYFILQIYAEPIVNFGFSAPAPGRNIATGVGTGVGLTLVSFGYGEVVEWFGYAYEHPYLELFSNSSSPTMSAAVVFAVVALLPVAEEIFFRGFIFSVLNRKMSTSAAIITSATLFGIAHLSPLSLVFDVVFGVVLAVLLQKSTSLISPIAAHVTFNAIALALTAAAGPRVELLGG